MKLLVIDTSYNLNAIKEKKLYEAIFSRDLNGFFEKVWSVHPLADITSLSNTQNNYGKVEISKLNDNHYFIEGKIGKFLFLKKIKFLNFFFSQIEIFIFLKRLIKKEKINFIKSTDPHYNSLLAYLLSITTKIPFLIRVSGNFDKIYQDTKEPIMKRFFIFRFVEKIFEKFIFNKTQYVIAPNNDNLEYAFANGLKKERGSVVRYGSLIDKKHLTKPSLRKEEFFFKEELKLDSNSKYLIYVGRLEKVKRVMNLISIIRHINNNQVKLLIVGKGSLKKDIEAQIKLNNLNNRIFLLGEKDQAWLSRCLPNCSCFLATHTGRALAEASFAGLPVVGYDIDWHSEIIQDSFNGFLVKPGDDLAFSKAILEILNNKDLSKKFSKNIREKAEILLSPEKICKIEIECFKKIKKF
jgi:glycosyltransferase involved in cell wall biosynthesis